MTFDELCQEVYILTNRPDLVNETKSAIKAATLKAHQSDFYSKDIFETVIQAEEAAYIHSIDYPSIISNFRALRYIRKLDSSGEVSGFISVISPEDIFDLYGQNKTDVAYIAGRVIELRSSTSVQKVILGCYVFPIVAEASYASWIAEYYPYAIVYEATRVVFKTIGYDEQSAQYEKLVAEQFTLLRQSALADVGY